MGLSVEAVERPAAAAIGPQTVPRELNLGCGRRKRPHCLNVDVLPAVAPDLVWDLDVHPYPLPRNHFQRIYAGDVVEHLDDIPAFMEEVHALLVPGGVLEITTPHFSSPNSFTDPTHRHHFGYFSFDYFADESWPWAFYSAARFVYEERLLVFHPGHFARLVARWANRRPARYEERYTWLYPAWFLILKLRAVKEGRAG